MAQEETYTTADALRDICFSTTEFERIVQTWQRKKNLILQGPPGVGKTLLAERLACRLIGSPRPNQVGMIQFHQSYAYEDFVQGLRPNERGGFERRDGVFLRFCQLAADDPAETFVFIIDEINRGNLSKIFGELLMLIEADKRSAKYQTPLTYSDRPFFVPANVHLLGLMNTADRSLALVDYAFRRRFAFVTVQPKFDDEFRQFLIEHDHVPASLAEKIVGRFAKLNQRIANDQLRLGPGFEIGHSFFCSGGLACTRDDTWYRTIIETEIAPLLAEYWFDEPNKAEDEIAELLR